MVTTRSKHSALIFLESGLLAGAVAAVNAYRDAPGRLADGRSWKEPANLNPPSISTDPSVMYDYPIVYVRLPCKGFWGDRNSKFESPVWAQAGVPLQMHP